MKVTSDKISWGSLAKTLVPVFESQAERIAVAVQGGEMKHQFDKFLAAMQSFSVRVITAEELVEFLALYWLTGPAWESIFKRCPFVSRNPVSQNLNIMLRKLSANGCIVESTECLRKFYGSVESRMADVRDAMTRQDLINELCQTFITIAFPRIAKQMGVVYTPWEIVDFINHSVDDSLQASHGRRLTDPDVAILDPFAGTGNFMVRLLCTGLIRNEDMRRKYEHEITCHEICLFAWYIGLIAIESAYHEIMGHEEYVPFRAMRLVDTFAEYEQESIT